MRLNAILNFTIRGRRRARGDLRGEREFKGEAKCSALLMAEKVIFYQSISNDDKTPEGASMLYYCLISTNLGTPVERGWK